MSLTDDCNNEGTQSNGIERSRNYNAEAATLAKRRMMEFLKRQLK